MYYIIFSKEGTPYKSNLDQAIVQGSFNTDKIFVGIDDDEFEPLDYVGQISFKRSDDSTSPEIVMSYGDFEFEGKTYHGYFKTLDSYWYSELDGNLKITVAIKKYKDSQVTSNRAFGIFNITIQEAVHADANVYITDEQYNAILEALQNKADKSALGLYYFSDFVFENYAAFAEASVNKQKEFTQDEAHIPEVYSGFVRVVSKITTALCVVHADGAVVVSGMGNVMYYGKQEDARYAFGDLIIENGLLRSGKVTSSTLSNIIYEHSHNAKQADFLFGEPTKDENPTTKKYVDYYIPAVQETQPDGDKKLFWIDTSPLNAASLNTKKEVVSNVNKKFEKIVEETNNGNKE